MGFTWDTAITTNADLEIGEQQLANLLRSGNTYTALHVDASNAIQRDLKGMGYDPSKVDTKYFEREARLYCFVEIFTAQVREGNSRAQLKAQVYLDQYLREKRTNRDGLPHFLETPANATTERRGPRAMNPDGGSFYEPALPKGYGTRHGEQTLPSFDEFVKDAPL